MIREPCCRAISHYANTHFLFVSLQHPHNLIGIFIQRQIVTTLSYTYLESINYSKVRIVLVSPCPWNYSSVAGIENISVEIQGEMSVSTGKIMSYAFWVDTNPDTFLMNRRKKKQASSIQFWRGCGLEQLRPYLWLIIARTLRSQSMHCLVHALKTRALQSGSNPILLAHPVITVFGMTFHMLCSVSFV